MIASFFWLSCLLPSPVWPCPTYSYVSAARALCTFHIPRGYILSVCMPLNGIFILSHSAHNTHWYIVLFVLLHKLAAMLYAAGKTLSENHLFPQWIFTHAQKHHTKKSKLGRVFFSCVFLFVCIQFSPALWAFFFLLHSRSCVLHLCMFVYATLLWFSRFMYWCYKRSNKDGIKMARALGVKRRANDMQVAWRGGMGA